MGKMVNTAVVRYAARYNRMERVLECLKWMTELGGVVGYRPERATLEGLINWGPRDEDRLLYSADVGRRALNDVWELPRDEDALYRCLLELKARTGHEEALRGLVDMMVDDEHREWMTFAKEWAEWAEYDLAIVLGRDGRPMEREDKDRLRVDFKDHIREQLRDGKTVWLVRVVSEEPIQG